MVAAGLVEDQRKLMAQIPHLVRLRQLAAVVVVAMVKLRLLVDQAAADGMVEVVRQELAGKELPEETDTTAAVELATLAVAVVVAQLQQEERRNLQ